VTLNSWLTQAQKFAVDNSPAILTGFGVVGSIATAIVAGRVSYKVGYRVALRDTYRAQRDEDCVPTKDIVKEYWAQYIPPVIMGVGTVACIVGSNQINTKRTTAMATAYALSEKAFSEYKDKVVEKVGPKKEKDVRAEIAEDRIKKNPPDPMLISADGSQVLILDAMSGRYFMSTMETIRRAQNTINEQCLSHRFATLEDFYDLLGLEPTTLSRELGWTSDNLMRIDFSAVLTPDKRPCMVIEYMAAPIRGDFR
jgi:hypothetical protein